MLRTGSEGGRYEHIPPDKSGEDNQRIQLNRMLTKESLPHRKWLFNIIFGWWIVSLLFLFISRALDVLILLVFPHDFICALLFSYQL